ncbi:MAG: DUF1559 domain-containing protein [Phycisphaeraceae bacterium]|nr:DUF1559 domain-containing protein [Phycisphaeraceae bacterium]
MPNQRPRPAFTLIELLVVIALVALLVGILLPSLSAARETARQAKCSVNLRSLATAATSHAADRRGAFSTGPFDNRTNSSYGALDEKGWVADYIKGGYAVPGHALCPSSPSQANQNLSLPRVNDGPYRPFTQQQIEELIDQGYNTNYCQSWYMAYTEMKTPDNATSPDPKDIRYVRGPLNDRSIGNGAIPSRVPLFGDGTALTLEDIVLYQNTQLTGCKSVTDGPRINQIPGFGTAWGRQDYTDFGPVHGKGSYVGGAVKHNKVYGQIGFADGHVEGFNDTKRDGLWGHTSRLVNGVNTHVYDELEGKVFGGWLSRPGLPF